MYTPIPSLHRPALIQSAGGTPNRNIMLRPIQDANDHPNFTGSNPNFSPTWDGFTQNGSQWDVDNTGSGVPDSVWVDLGLPVRADNRRAALQAAVRHPLRGPRRPAEPQRPRE